MKPTREIRFNKFFKGCNFSPSFPSLPLPSHPHLVAQVVTRGLAQVVVFEDDVRFESNFKGRLEQLMEEVEAEKLPWDLM